MSLYRIGCTGWSYEDWCGPFYPTACPVGEQLQRYARVFRLVEVDSTHYRTPTRDEAEWWSHVTPEAFTFCVKLPSDLTHKAALGDVQEDLDAFLAALEPLQRAQKLGPLVAQLPAAFQRDQNEPALRAFVEGWPSDLPLAVELHHASWWRNETYDLLRRANAALVWSVSDEASTPQVRTADWLYVRTMGDRTVTRFDRIQRDRTSQLRTLCGDLESQRREVKTVFVLLNNHFMGHAPETARILAVLLQEPPPDLAKASREPGQRDLAQYGAPINR